MSWARWFVEDREMPPPTTLNWQSPNVLGTSITGEPVIGSGWKCTISYGLTIEPFLIVEELIGMVGSRVRMVIYPSPMSLCEDNAVYGSIASVGIRYSQDTIAGIDVEVTHIVPAVGV